MTRREMLRMAPMAGVALAHPVAAMALTAASRVEPIPNVHNGDLITSETFNRIINAVNEANHGR